MKVLLVHCADDLWDEYILEECDSLIAEIDAILPATEGKKDE